MQRNSSQGLTEVERQSYKAFFYASHLMGEAIERKLSEARLESAVEYDVLYTLREAPGHRLAICEIAANLTLSHSGLSRLLDRLEKRGYVSRCTAEHDRRSVSVSLLEAGRLRVDEVWAVIASVVEMHFGQPLTQEEHTLLLGLMRKILPSLISAKESEAGLPFIHIV